MLQRSERRHALMLYKKNIKGYCDKGKYLNMDWVLKDIQRHYYAIK